MLCFSEAVKYSRTFATGALLNKRHRTWSIDSWHCKDLFTQCDCGFDSCYRHKWIVWDSVVRLEQ